MHFDQLKRREFITLLGGATATWPLAAHAQQPATPVVGFLSNGWQQSDAVRLAAFRQGLSEIGYVEGQNVASEYRWAEDHYDRLPALAAELVRRQPTVIVAVGGPASALAAKTATKTISIVFAMSSDPVKLGLVASLNRPGGNMTGATTLASMVVAKQFEALHETVPKATVAGFLVNPNNPSAETDTREAQEATRTLGLQLNILNASTEREIDTAFTTLTENGAGGVVVVADALFNSRPNQLVALAARHALPTIYSLREFAEAGGLLSYGTSIADVYRQVGVYTGRILKGEKPADLPVVQSTRVELVINVKTAKSLGLTFPITLLGRADEVIE
jgi:putative ABC transport system substrate-binding protein